VNEELILAAEVDARRVLRGRRLRFSVLVPVGSWAGSGALRVLRLRTLQDESAELIAGYERYERLGDPL
jgi:hypothetical protein